MANKKQLQAKYNRLREDPSQLQMFGDEMIDLVCDNEDQISHIEDDVLHTVYKITKEQWENSKKY